MAELFVEKLKAALGAKLLSIESLSGRDCAVIEPSILLQAVDLLRGDAELALDLLIDLAGADYSGAAAAKPAPLCVSYQFYSSTKKQRAWLKAYLPLEGAEIDSLTSRYVGANWYEREAWDMYGVVFKGHPYLKRLLLYDEFQGHPLRKDYPLLKAQPLIPMRNAVDYEAVLVKNRQESGEA